MTVQSLYGPISQSKHELNARYVTEYNDPEPVKNKMTLSLDDLSAVFKKTATAFQNDSN